MPEIGDEMNSFWMRWMRYWMLGSSRSRFEVFMFNWIAQPDCGTYQFRRTLGGTCTLQKKGKHIIGTRSKWRGGKLQKTWYVPHSSIFVMYEYGGPRFGDSSKQLQHPPQIKFNIDPAMSRAWEDCFPLDIGGYIPSYPNDLPRNFPWFSHGFSP